MFNENHATLIRQGVLIRVARAFFDGTLAQTAPRIPREMRPQQAQPLSCCTWHDRALIHGRVLAALGHGTEAGDDDRPLDEAATDALQRTTVAGPTLTVIAAACSACVRSRFEVTSTCRGCIARPCLSTCPRTAISMAGRRALIDTERCVSCGKCQQVCPYHAIVRIPIPCEEACPVEAISKRDDGTAVIDHDACIVCGKCAVACPFGAIAEKSQLLDVLRALRGSRPVIALPAPAVYGQFAGGYDRLAGALRALGFAAVIEVAEGADATTREETAEFLERLHGGAKLMTTSCCPAYVAAVEKHVPALLPFVSHTPSPMRLTARAVRDRQPDAITVFIGPCTAKRDEALQHPEIDFVLTFEELDAVFVASDIAVELQPATPAGGTASDHARGYAAVNGVTAAVKAALPPDVTVVPVAVNGLSRKNLKLLKAYAAKCPGNFLEVMACEGGCVAGPRNLVSPQAGAAALPRPS